MMTSSRRARSNVGFTLVELLVSMVVLSIMLVLLTQLTGSLRTVIARTTSSVDAFKEARDAFETMTRRIAQATLNSYDDLNPNAVSASGSATGTSYLRASELRFISGDAGTLIAGSSYPSSVYPTDAIFFQAPLGFSTGQNTNLTQLLNTCGYFIQWGSDQNLRPSFLPASVPYHYRFRLMEVLEPSENLQLYNKTSGPSTTVSTRSASWDYTARDWFQYPVLTETPSPVHVLAENVIFLAVLPIVAPQNAQIPPNGAPDGTSTDLVKSNYLYDTAPSLTTSPVPPAQNQLPPLVYIEMIAVDEPSFIRYQAANGTATPTNLGLGGILVDASYTQRQTDVNQVTQKLTAAKISYRIFSIAIPLGAH